MLPESSIGSMSNKQEHWRSERALEGSEKPVEALGLLWDIRGFWGRLRPPQRLYGHSDEHRFNKKAVGQESGY
jgi:hypothetical protein